MLRKSATTTPKQSTLQGPLAKMGMEAGLETLNQQRCSPRSCHSVGLGQLCRRFSNTVCMRFQQQLQPKLRFAELHFISGSCEIGLR